MEKNTKKGVIKISGMSCGHCVNRVENALSKLDGVKKAKVSLSKERAVVKYDKTEISGGDLKAAVEEAGYAVID